MTISEFADICLVLNGDTPESLFSRADEQLYISKESGRNRVHIS